MAAKCYYNEHDPFAAAWLRELIAWNMIAPGDVDERSIEDVCADDLRGYIQCHFFAGIGVWSAALRGAGWPDDRPVWTGSCPCQPFSAAGKGGGFADERHLWPTWHWLIRQHRPDVVLGEQVASRPGLAWFDLVSADLEGEGYAVGATDLGAASVGAPHIRQRLWFVAHHHQRRDGCGLGAGATGRGVAAYGSSGRMADPSSSRSGRDTGGVLGAQGSGGHQGIEVGCFPDQLVADGPVVEAAGEQTGLPRRTWQSGGAGAGVLADDGGQPGAGRSDAGEVRGLQKTQREPEHGADVPGRSGWLGDDERDGLRERRGPETDLPDEPGHWALCDWIPCRDGKWRPVEAGTFPLAHGAPARVGLLRGYGNAIVKPVAEAFIAAAMTVLP